MYSPTFESVKQHPLPQWYDDAKFGIFIHWGLYSVPAFAPRIKMDLGKLLTGEIPFSSTPYAEWYLNSLRVPGSPVHQYHQEKFGTNFAYEDFAPIFNKEIDKWNPEMWANAFEDAGAQYVVLTTKHHDGFLLWPSRHDNPKRPGYHASRDITGELCRAVTQRGMKFGCYYSSLLDWSFVANPITGAMNLMTNGDPGKVYRAYVENHWMELIERYDPWILWSDIGYPPSYHLPNLFAYYYNRKPDGLVNDRWMQLHPLFFTRPGQWLLKKITESMLKRAGKSGEMAQLKVPHSDYATTEYAYYQEAPKFKWEACRGIGSSFGFNQVEELEDYQSAPQLIRALIEIVSANGNLLLNVGPRADGSIHGAQLAALKGIGDWLAVNGDAIYATRPWSRIKDSGEDGAQVRYTQKGSVLNILITSLPSTNALVLPELPVRVNGHCTLLGTGRMLEINQSNGKTVIELLPGLSPDIIPVLQVELA